MCANRVAVCGVRRQLEELEEAHMLRGELTASQQLALLSSYDDMAQALEGAFFVQVGTPRYDPCVTSVTRQNRIHGINIAPLSRNNIHKKSTFWLISIQT